MSQPQTYTWQDLYAAAPCLTAAMEQDSGDTRMSLTLLADGGFTPAGMHVFEETYGNAETFHDWHYPNQLRLMLRTLVSVRFDAEVTPEVTPAEALAWLRHWVTVDDEGTIHDNAPHTTAYNPDSPDDLGFEDFDETQPVDADAEDVTTWLLVTDRDNEAAILAASINPVPGEVHEYVTAAGDAMTGVLALAAGLSLSEIKDRAAAGTLDADGLRALVALAGPAAA